MQDRRMLLLLLVVVVMVVVTVVLPTLLRMLWHGVVGVAPFRVISIVRCTFFSICGSFHGAMGQWAGAVAAVTRAL
jgi:hypothetical protein